MGVLASGSPTYARYSIQVEDILRYDGFSNERRVLMDA